MIRAAVVGVGYLGRFHAHKYARMEGVRLVGVVDPDLERAQSVARECDTEAFTDLGAIEDRIDAASVASPTVHHHAIAKRLLSLGVHCLVEKPITTTVEEADDLVSIARDRGAILQVGHIERFNPAVALLFERTKNPLFIEAHRLSGFKKRSLDVDVVLDLMIHDLEIILALANAPVKEIRAVGVPVITPRVDIANARIIFANGCTANLTASRISLQAMRRIRIFQPGGYISADCTDQKNVVVTRKPGAYGLEAIKPDIITHEKKDMLEEEIASFVRAVRGEGDVLVGGEAGRNALALAIEIEKTIEEGLASLGVLNH